jgi:predicted transcriptional regulator
MLTDTRPEKIVTSLRVEADLDAKLQVIADREFLTKSDIFRRALRQYLANNG